MPGIDVTYYDWLRRLEAYLDSVAAGGGLGLWTRDAANGELYPTTLTDELGLGTADPGTNLVIYENNADTEPALLVEQDGVGDAAMEFTITGVRSWSLGIDNDDLDKFKLSAGFDLATSTLLTITTGGLVGIGDVAPPTNLSIYENNADVVPALLIEQDSTGDAAMEFLLTGGQAWSVGIDNSDNDAFKIAAGAIVNTNTWITIETTGEVGFGNSSPAVHVEIYDNDASTVPTLSIEQDSTGDAAMRWILTGGQAYSFGIDNDDGDKLKISTNSGDVGTSALLTLQNDGHLGLGTEAPTTENLYVYDATVDGIVSRYGYRSYHVKTAGATDLADTMTASYVEFQMNHAGGTIGNLKGYDSNIWLVDGTVDGEVAAGELLAYQTGGITDYFTGLGVYANQDAGTINNDAYGIQVLMDLDGTVTGTSYMLYLLGFDGADYGVWQLGATCNYFSSDTGIGIDPPTSRLHPYENADASGRPVVLIEQDHATGGHAVLEIQQDDADEPFILFTGTVDAGKTEADEYLRVETPAGDRYIRLYT